MADDQTSTFIHPQSWARERSHAKGINIMSTTSLLAGVAGEYFVAAELSRRGYIASITLRNTRGIDIVVTNKDATKTVTIQCKTTQRFADQKFLRQGQRLS